MTFQNETVLSVEDILCIFEHSNEIENSQVYVIWKFGKKLKNKTASKTVSWLILTLGGNDIHIYYEYTQKCKTTNFLVMSLTKYVFPFFQVFSLKLWNLEIFEIGKFSEKTKTRCRKIVTIRVGKLVKLSWRLN